MEIETQKLTKVKDEFSGLVLTKDSNSEYFSLHSIYSSGERFEFSISDLKAFREMIDTMLENL